MFSGLGLIAFACIAGAAAAGFALQGYLQDDHRGEATRDAVKTMMNVVAILTALVLGLLVAGAKSNFDTRSNEIEKFSTNLTLLDRELTRLPDKALRELLREYTKRKLALTWPKDRSAITLEHDASTVAMLDEIEEHILGMPLQNDADRARSARMLALIGELKQTSRLLVVQQSDRIPRPFLFVVIFWLCALFLSYALFAPRNRVVIGAIAVCGLSVSIAINLIFDMDQPFAGFVSVSSRSLQQALDEMTP